jgi:hypothetical protein
LLRCSSPIPGSFEETTRGGKWTDSVVLIKLAEAQKIIR